MAREYNEVLRVGGGANYLRDAIELAERQLALLSLFPRHNKGNHALSYLESLKKKSLAELKSLLGEKEIPSCHERVLCAGNPYTAFVNAQAELFIRLDYIKEYGSDVSAIVETEHRVLGFLGTIR